MPLALPSLSFRRVAAVSASLVIGFVLLMPGEWVPQVTHAQELGLHAAVFFALALTWTLALPRTPFRVALALAAVAAGSEWVQANVVPLRTGALDDLLANLAGLTVGAVIGIALTRRDRRDAPGLANEAGR